MTTDAEYRYITSNSVPDYYYNPYCPIGLGYGYCVEQEIEADMCMFPDLICGEDNGSGLLHFSNNACLCTVKASYYFFEYCDSRF